MFCLEMTSGNRDPAVWLIDCRDESRWNHVKISSGSKKAEIMKRIEPILRSYTSNHPFFSPEKFLGRQAYSYGQLLTITFTSETTELLPNNVTLLLQGTGTTLTADLSPQPPLNRDPGLTPRQSFTVRYSENGPADPQQIDLFVC